MNTTTADHAAARQANEAACAADSAKAARLFETAARKCDRAILAVEAATTAPQDVARMINRLETRSSDSRLDRDARETCYARATELRRRNQAAEELYRTGRAIRLEALAGGPSRPIVRDWRTM